VALARIVRVGLAEGAVALERGVDAPLGVGVSDLERLEDARREAQAAGPVAGDLRIALEAPYHDRGELAPVGAHRAGEALVVEQLEQRAEALRIAVVRR